MKLGDRVRLKDGFNFSGARAELTGAIGIVGEVVERPGGDLITVNYEQFGILAPRVPADLFEPATVH